MLPDMSVLKATARNRWAPEFSETDSSLKSAAQTGTIISVVTVGVVALIGTLIISQIDGALPAISNSDLSNTQTSILDGVAGAMDLVPVILIVLVASVVIGVVSRLRGGGGMA